MELTPTEQQQVDKMVTNNCACTEMDCVHSKSFRRGITFALQHLLPGRLEKFSEWVRTFEALERQNGHWVIESQLSDKQIVNAFIEDLKQQQDGTNPGIS